MGALVFISTCYLFAQALHTCCTSYASPYMWMVQASQGPFIKDPWLAEITTLVMLLKAREQDLLDDHWARTSRLVVDMRLNEVWPNAGSPGSRIALHMKQTPWGCSHHAGEKGLEIELFIPQSRVTQHGQHVLFILTSRRTFPRCATTMAVSVVHSVALG